MAILWVGGCECVYTNGFAAAADAVLYLASGQH